MKKVWIQLIQNSARQFLNFKLLSDVFCVMVGAINGFGQLYYSKLEKQGAVCCVCFNKAYNIVFRV